MIEVECKLAGGSGGRRCYRAFGGGGFGLGVPVVSEDSCQLGALQLVGIRTNSPYAPRPIFIATSTSLVIMDVATERKSQQEFAGGTRLFDARQGGTKAVT